MSEVGKLEIALAGSLQAPLYLRAIGPLITCCSCRQFASISNPDRVATVMPKQGKFCCLLRALKEFPRPRDTVLKRDGLERGTRPLFGNTMDTVY
jgi:hypothetical protein